MIKKTPEITQKFVKVGEGNEIPLELYLSLFGINELIKTTSREKTRQAPPANTSLPNEKGMHPYFQGN